MIDGEVVYDGSVQTVDAPAVRERVREMASEFTP